MKNNQLDNFKKFLPTPWLKHYFDYAQIWFSLLTTNEQTCVKNYARKLSISDNLFLSYYNIIVLSWFLFNTTLK